MKWPVKPSTSVALIESAGIFLFQDPTQWLCLAGHAFKWLNSSSVWAMRQAPQISIQASHLMALWASPDNYLEFMFHLSKPLHPHRCRPACLHSGRAGEIKCEWSISKSKEALWKNQTSGTGADLRLRRCETTRPEALPSTGCVIYSITEQCGFKGASGRTSSLLKTGLASKLHRVAHGLVQPSFENLQKMGISQPLWDFVPACEHTCWVAISHCRLSMDPASPVPAGSDSRKTVPYIEALTPGPIPRGTEFTKIWNEAFDGPQLFRSQEYASSVTVTLLQVLSPVLLECNSYTCNWSYRIAEISAITHKLCKSAELSLQLTQTQDFKMKGENHNFPVVPFASKEHWGPYSEKNYQHLSCSWATCSCWLRFEQRFPPTCYFRRTYNDFSQFRIQLCLDTHLSAFMTCSISR